MKKLRWVILGVAVAALLFGILSLGGFHQAPVMGEELGVRGDTDIEGLIEQLVGKFEESRINYDLQWWTKSSLRAEVGSFR